VVALDLPDRGEHGPVDAEAGCGLLVENEVVGRNVGDRDGRRREGGGARGPADDPAHDHDDQEHERGRSDEGGT
jgi:hypothetical protein